jgi:hypothetical protein
LLGNGQVYTFLQRNICGQEDAKGFPLPGNGPVNNLQLGTLHIKSLVTEPLPSYQQFLIVGFRGYESCTLCLAKARLEDTYFLRYFGPLGRMPLFSLFILFLILIQSDKRGK